jgi:hypothetical protein
LTTGAGHFAPASSYEDDIGIAPMSSFFMASPRDGLQMTHSIRAAIPGIRSFAHASLYRAV